VPDPVSDPVIARFAPSPTGLIHIGNARTALINALLARKTGGTFILRFDDTDAERSRTEYADATAEDLAWLGIVPDRVERQSARVAAYEEAADRLRRDGLLYPCYETADELERKRRRRLARGLPPVYDRAALKLTDEERQALEAEGRKPHWRFLLPNFSADPADPSKTDIGWDDGCRGAQTVDISSLSDPVLVRADGTYLYTLPSVVDDLDMGVTLICRGDDHVTNTAVQIVLAHALGGVAPAFAHHNLLTTASGEGLSKRLGSLSIRSLRESGLEPMAVASLAVLIGTSAPVEPCRSLDELADKFTLHSVSRSPARFDPADLVSLNARLLHETPFAEVSDRLAELGIGGGESFWDLARRNVVRLDDAGTWWHVVEGPVAPDIAEADAAFLEEARALLPEGQWDLSTWSAWTGAVKAATGRKGKDLFMPLRKALTGLDHGPELKALLPLIGRDKATARLSGEPA